MSDRAVQDAVDVLRAGRIAILPTDTVYGMCVTPYRSDQCERLYRLKGRDPLQPSALLAAELDMLLELLPELRGRAGVIARTLLPGPYTLILPNPARRYRWLTGSNQDSIGVRVPDLPEPTATIVREVGAVVATSANHPGGPDPRVLDDVPEEIRTKAGAVVDGGETLGIASTVIDFTGEEPRVVREGAAPAEDAIARAVAALA